MKSQLENRLEEIKAELRKTHHAANIACGRHQQGTGALLRKIDDLAAEASRIRSSVAILDRIA